MRLSNIGLICTAAILATGSSMAFAYSSDRNVPGADGPTLTSDYAPSSAFRFSSSSTQTPANGQGVFLNETGAAAGPELNQERGRPLGRLPASEFERDFYGYR